MSRGTFFGMIYLILNSQIQRGEELFFSRSYNFLDFSDALCHLSKIQHEPTLSRVMINKPLSHLACKATQVFF